MFFHELGDNGDKFLNIIARSHDNCNGQALASRAFQLHRVRKDSHAQQLL